jgi:TPR repeat protein
VRNDKLLNPRGWLFAILMLATALPVLAANLGNYRRDMDEANRQRMANEFRRDAEISARRNEETRKRNAYEPSSSGSGSGSSRSSIGSGSSPTYPGSSSSGPQSIESSTTVTISRKETEAETAQRLLKEAGAGSMESQWNAGRLYYTGGYGGIARDDVKAAQWFKKAAEAGHGGAALSYGEMALNGKGMPESLSEAARWFKVAAESGIPRAMFFWGTLLETGSGTKQDFPAAFVWIKKAAEQKEAYAYRSLAMMYEEGRGTPENITEAVKWLKLAVEHGDAEAYVDMGGLYYQGKGVPKNQVEAGKYFLKGAEAGNVMGMRNAGLMYEQGLFGAAIDIPKAIHWFAKAGAAGDKEAQRASERLAKSAQSGAASPDAASKSITGHYTVTGKNPNGSSYSGVVTIEKAAKGYRFVWNISGTIMHGSGDYAGQNLVIDWGSTYPVIYTLASDGRLVGTWGNGQASETLTPAR